MYLDVTVKLFRFLLFFFALQPQNSMPDVVVWLISGTKRIASFRIPAYDVLYSPNVESCGQYCSKVFNMFMKVTTVCCRASGLFSARNGTKIRLF